MIRQLCLYHDLFNLQSEIFVKFDSGIAVDQQTRTRDQIFEGILDPNHPPATGARGAATPIFREGPTSFYLIPILPFFAPRMR